VQTRGALFLTISIVFISVATKFVSGFAGAAIAGFGSIKSILVGSAMVPQLSTTLAVVFTARSLGLLNEQIITSMIILSVVTTFIGPFAINRIASKLDK